MQSKESSPGRVRQSISKIFAIQPSQSQVQWNRTQQLSILDSTPIPHHQSLGSSIDMSHLALLTEAHSLLRQELSHILPNATSATVLGETENGIGTPATLSAVPDDRNVYIYVTIRLVVKRGDLGDDDCK